MYTIYEDDLLERILDLNGRHDAVATRLIFLNDADSLVRVGALCRIMTDQITAALALSGMRDLDTNTKSVTE